MGRKSSAKAQAKPTSAAGPNPPSDGGSPMKIVAIAAVAIAAAVAIYAFSSRTEPQQTQTPTAAAVSPVPDSALQGPHPQADLPPLPLIPEPPARSPEVVRAAYKFAAEHSEVLSYVPCYCGCERSGHRGNEDCFVTARDAKGDVTQWEPHGMT
jgi:type IV secretory pathway VirB10-like protein